MNNTSTVLQNKSVAFSLFGLLTLFIIWILLGNKTVTIPLEEITPFENFAYSNPVHAPASQFTFAGKTFTIDYKVQNTDSINHQGRSKLMLFENGNKLGPPHSSHEQINKIGRGHFRHWESNLYFSSSDNTDPRTNKKTYTIQFKCVMKGKTKKTLNGLVILFLLILSLNQKILTFRLWIYVNTLYRRIFSSSKMLWLSLGLPGLLAIVAHCILFFSSPILISADSTGYLLFTHGRGPGVGLLAHGAFFAGGEFAIKLLWHFLALCSVALAGFISYLLMRSHLAVFLVTLFSAFGTEQFFYTSVLSSEIPVMFFSLLFLLSLLRFLQQSRVPALYLAFFSASYAALVRTENILLLFIAVLVSVLKMRRQPSTNCWIHLSASLLLSLIPLQLQCWQIFKHGSGWRLNDPGYEAVSYYDGSIVNASYIDKREMIDVKNKQVDLIRKCVWKFRDADPKALPNFSANCWTDFGALQNGGGLSIRDADRVLLKAVIDFYLRDPIWTLQFLGLKIWKANTLYLHRPFRALSEKEVLDADHAILEGCRASNNQHLKLHGYSMQISDRYYGNDTWLKAHDVFFQWIYNQQLRLADSKFYLPLVFLGFFCCFFYREKLLWLSVGGVFFVRCLLIPIISFCLSRTVSPGYPIALILAMSVLYKSWNTLLHGTQVLKDFKTTQGIRRVFFFSLLLTSCLLFAQHIRLHNVPKITSKKIQTLSNQTVITLKVEGVLPSSIRQVTFIDWRHNAEYSTQNHTLEIEIQKLSQEITLPEKSKFLLVLKPKYDFKSNSGPTSYEIEIELLSGKILWDYLTPPPEDSTSEKKTKSSSISNPKQVW